ncbi:unnamed protein product [Darwinula stevensoni]|uniref:Uncharacterized protein n=1 Tax=Darwinula stevensoni TaxID=69355 RepID=A0A7R8XH91_9CRUS|nr:unnamed protein product [Darwinula stevensoni]CAG0892531.1 unnamed protein product [Darwinula stevensoni]
MLGSLTLFLLLSSASGQLLCPEPAPEDIAPCTCTYEGSPDFIVVDCSDANDDEQTAALNDVFWPITEITEFRLLGNIGLTSLPEGHFGNLTFESIRMEYTSIASVHPQGILQSASRLTSLQLTSSVLEEFPFEMLPDLPVLKRLDLGHDRLPSVPAITSPSLEYLRLRYNRLSTLETGWNTPNLKTLDLGGNYISALPSGFFDSLGSLEEFWCDSCDLGPNVTAGSFRFQGLAAETNVSLALNEIVHLPEDAFRSILEDLSNGDGVLYLASRRIGYEAFPMVSETGNPIVCDCSLKWLVTEASLLASVEGECQDGTQLQDLNPEIWGSICPFEEASPPSG